MKTFNEQLINLKDIRVKLVSYAHSQGWVGKDRTIEGKKGFNQLLNKSRMEEMLARYYGYSSTAAMHVQRQAKVKQLPRASHDTLKFFVWHNLNVPHDKVNDFLDQLRNVLGGTPEETFQRYFPHLAAGGDCE